MCRTYTQSIHREDDFVTQDLLYVPPGCSTFADPWWLRSPAFVNIPGCTVVDKSLLGPAAASIACDSVKCGKKLHRNVENQGIQVRETIDLSKFTNSPSVSAEETNLVSKHVSKWRDLNWPKEANSKHLYSTWKPSMQALAEQTYLWCILLVPISRPSISWTQHYSTLFWTRLLILTKIICAICAELPHFVEFKTRKFLGAEKKQLYSCKLSRLNPARPAISTARLLKSKKFCLETQTSQA